MTSAIIQVWSRGPKGDLFREVYQTHWGFSLYCRLPLSPGFTLDLLPPHATALPLSLPFSLLSISLLSCTVVHKFLGSISILSETVLVNPSCPGAWTLPPWRTLGHVSAHLICLPCLCAPWCTRSKICFIYFVQFSSCKVNSTFNCEKEVMVIFWVYLQMCHFTMVGYVIIALSLATHYLRPAVDKVSSMACWLSLGDEQS